MKTKVFWATISFVLAVGLGASIYFVIIPKLQPSQVELYELDPHVKAIKERGTIIIGTEASYPPMEFIDENGNFVGVDIDIAKEIAKNLRVEPEFKNIVWDELFDKLLAGEVDMLISSITILPERTEIMAFSDPYFNAGQVIIVKESRAIEIKNPDDLYNKRIGVQGNTTSDFEAQKYTNKVVRYSTYQEAIEDLLAEKIDAIVIDYPAGIALVREIEGLVITGSPFTQEFYGVAVRKKDQALLSLINKTLADLKRTGKLQQIINNWVQQ